MMRGMDSRVIAFGVVAGALAGVLMLAACGGGKGADSPGTCPAGTVLKGSDCVPPGDEESAGGSGGGSKSSDDGEKSSSTGGGGGAGGGGSGGGGDETASSSGKAPYDKEAVDVQLKRASRQVKANCGSATGDEGKASGPWGSTKVSVTLGRNGHVRGVTVPSPYDGKPVGVCVVHAFEKIQFPPYPGSSDVVVDWDVEIVQPKH
jgi:hypothetical protein